VLGAAVCTVLVPTAALAQVVPVLPEFPISLPVAEAQFEPALAAVPDGSFFAAWRIGTGQPLSLPAPRILVRRFGAGGAPVSDSAQVNTSPVSRFIDRPSVAVSPPELCGSRTGSFAAATSLGATRTAVSPVRTEVRVSRIAVRADRTGSRAVATAV
jgi:hypothetical protein